MSEGERSSSVLSEEIEELQFGTYEECSNLEEIERSDMKNMIGHFTERYPNNIDTRSWLKPIERKDKSIDYYKTKTHSYEQVKCLLRHIQRNPTITRFNVKLEAYNCILTGAGDYEVDIRSNYPLLPTVWTFEMQRPDKKPFTFTATITVYENDDIHDFEVKTYTSTPMYERNGIVQTASHSSWNGGAVGRWDIELHLPDC